MKRIKSFLTVVMATIFALSLVPAGAWAATENSGRIDSATVTDTVGSITIKGSQLNETYSIYKLFDLASFHDENNAPGEHDAYTEQYSYVIDSNSPWYAWLMAQGYAVEKASNWTEGTPSPTPTTTQIFWIEPQDVTVGSTSTYRVITAETGKFNNSADVTDSTYKSTNFMTNADAKVIQDFAQAALAYAESTEGTTAGIRKAQADKTGTGNDTLAFTGLPLGYYLVGTTMGTLASLDTTNKDATIYEKNEKPTIQKAVLKEGSAAGTDNDVAYLTTTEGNGAVWVENTDADFKDYVQFRIVINAKQGAEHYVLHDYMEAGLELVITPEGTEETGIYTYAANASEKYDYSPKVYLVRGSTIHKINATELYNNGGEDVNYTNWTFAQPESSSNDKSTFTITFGTYGEGTDDDRQLTFKNSEDANLDVRDGDIIVATYWARVKDTAVVFEEADTATDTQIAVAHEDGVALTTNDAAKQNDGDHRNTNSTVLTYGHRSATTWDSADVTTYEFEVAKTAEQDATNGQTLLANAEFSLYRVSTTSTDKMIGATVADYTPVNGTTYYQTSNALSFANSDAPVYKYNGEVATAAGSATTTLVSDAGDVIRVSGLNAGTYLLVETKAPTGYNKLANPIVVEVVGDANYDATDDTDEGKIKVTSKDNNGLVNTSTMGTAGPAKVTMDGTVTTKYASGGVNVINQTGAELPSTGGIGTTIFYVAGTVLVVGAVVMLVAKRRMGSEA